MASATAAAAAAPARAAFWKLRGVYKWATVAPYVTNVAVSFDPAHNAITGLR
jgi:hypothetical protein